MKHQLFSKELQQWMKGDQPKTIKTLNETFLEKAHAVALLILLLPSALPIPTGGVTNVLEIIAMLIAVQLIIMRRSIWMPKRWQDTEIGEFGKKKVIPTIMKVVSKAEKFPNLRMKRLFDNRVGKSVLGLMMLIFTIGAFVAPPFSGLDTLPSMGVVLVALSILLENAYLLLLGVIAGGIGIALSISAFGFAGGFRDGVVLDLESYTVDDGLVCLCV